MSWVTRLFRLNWKSTKLPNVLVKMSIASWWLKYSLEPVSTYPEMKIGRKICFLIVQNLAKSDVGIIKCINGILWALVYDNLEVARYITEI